jgi:alkylation response protein AidB-like acyl-CoA dehydrogenase
MTATIVEQCFDDPTAARELWRIVAEGGWLALLAEPDSEELGTLELALLAEEVGAHLLAGPFAETIAIVVPLLSRWGDEALLRRVIRGETTVAVATPAPRWRGGLVWETHLRGSVDGSGSVTFSGCVIDVPYGGQTDLVMVFVDCGIDGRLAVLVEPGGSGVMVEHQAVFDATRRAASLSFASARVGPDLVVGHGDSAFYPELTLSLNRLIAARNGEALGGMTAVLDRTVSYVRDRRQFGVPVGSFQAVKHHLANAASAREVGRALAHRAAWLIDQDPTESLDLVCSRLLVGAAYADVCEIAIQCHGGFGFAWEQQLHLWYRRALVELARPAAPNELRTLVMASLREPMEC